MAVIALVLCAGAIALYAQEKHYTVHGMVLRVDPANRLFVVSHEEIQGLMSGMIMPFEVRDAGELRALAPGALVDFMLVIGKDAGYATEIKVLKYQTAELDPLTARRLALLKKASGRASPPLAVGQEADIARVRALYPAR